MKKNLKKLTNRKGFSLVELVVVILIIAILAVAVFAGGSVVIKKSQVSRAESDLHNFSVAGESFMNENPKIANTKQRGTGTQLKFEDMITKLNANLSEDYQIDATVINDAEATNISTNSNGNITVNGLAYAADTHVGVYKTAKEDPWGNPYYLILDSGERHGTVNSDFYIYVISAGPDAKTELAGLIGGTTCKKADDVFLMTQYENGDVSAVTYDMGSVDAINIISAVSDDNVATTGTVAKSAGEALYCATPDAGIQDKCPINW